MVKYFCDVCGKETTKSSFNSVKISDVADIILAINKDYTIDHVCKYCMIDAVKTLDDRK